MRAAHGRVALVTGGGQGIGRAVALRLAHDGTQVAITQRSPEPLERTVADIEQEGGIALAVPADVTVPKQVTHLAETVRDRLGPISILVNNAAFNRRRATFTEVDLPSWQEVLAADLTGPYLCAQAVVPQMIAQGWGRIVNIAAVQAWMPLPGNAAYAAAKGGLVALTRSLAVDLTELGIVVNGIAPGPVDPEAEDAPRDADDWPTLLGRRGLPREVAALAAFLVSEECTFLIGQTIVCDGGRMLSRKSEHA